MSPTPTTSLPKPLLAVRFGDVTLGSRLESAAEFAVPTGLATPVVPLNRPAKAMVAGDPTLGTRLTQLADIVRELPSGALDRLTVAPEFEGFHGARAAARLAIAADPTPKLATTVLGAMLSGANRFIEGEYIPSGRHLLLGPQASNGVLGRLASTDPAMTTRPAYVVAHEIAHARQPITNTEIQNDGIRRTEEARADLVARWSSLTDRVSAFTGLPVDRNRLAADPTYATERQSLEARLAQRGAGPGHATAAWLDATRAADIVATLGA